MASRTKLTCGPAWRCARGEVLCSGCCKGKRCPVHDTPVIPLGYLISNILKHDKTMHKPWLPGMVSLTNEPYETFIESFKRRTDLSISLRSSGPRYSSIDSFVKSLSERTTYNIPQHSPYVFHSFDERTVVLYDVEHRLVFKMTYCLRQGKLDLVPYTWLPSKLADYQLEVVIMPGRYKYTWTINPYWFQPKLSFPKEVLPASPDDIYECVFRWSLTLGGAAVQ